MTFILGFVSFLYSSAFALTDCNVSSLKKSEIALPSTPVRTLAIKPRGQERRVAGTVLQPDQSFGKATRGYEKQWIPSDDYLAIVLNVSGKPGDETVVYQPLVEPDRHDPTKYLATPESLLQMAANAMGMRKEQLRGKMLAVGTFRSVKDQFVMGTPPAGYEQSRENSQYLREVLESRGLVDASPQLSLVFKNDDAAMALQKQNMSSPERRAVRTTLAQLHALLVERMPDPNAKWKLHSEALNAWKERALRFRQGINDDESARLKMLGRRLTPQAETERRERLDAEMLALEDAMTRTIQSVNEVDRDGLDAAVDEFCRRMPNCEASMDDLLDLVMSVSHTARPR